MRFRLKEVVDLVDAGSCRPQDFDGRDVAGNERTCVQSLQFGARSGDGPGQVLDLGQQRIVSHLSRETIDQLIRIKHGPTPSRSCFAASRR